MNGNEKEQLDRDRERVDNDYDADLGRSWFFVRFCQLKITQVSDSNVIKPPSDKSMKQQQQQQAVCELF